MKSTIIILLTCLLLIGCQTPQDKVVERQQTPLMGWASWNSFRININGEIIMAQADAMISTGLKDAGYSYINIDDGYFGGRDEKGNLIAHPERFPKGMKALSDYIHSKGLKAGIYTDAGINTCASYWDKDTIGVGMGLWGHDEQDIKLMLKEWNYDFIKVDWCGGQWLGMDEETRYTEIGRIVRETRPDVVYNICRWEFPGEWATRVADSWRVSGDIGDNYKSIMRIIDLNADLWKYSSPGHVNDMDILQVGRGMSYEEDKTHFTMWCIMNSPLLIGDDLRNISDETIEILTNKELIALNQDPLGYQARRLVNHGDLEVWAKPLISTMSGQVAVTLLNRSEEKDTIAFSLDSLGIDVTKDYAIRDLWLKKDYETSINEEMNFEVPAHGVVVLKISGTAKPFNVFQFK
ncbi:MAG: glycoside hydrolase family 27 protein [Bacteroidota bacterium]|nr:glycoside hydrolase family 27 protein [Bacteroidota bacterium]